MAGQTVVENSLDPQCPLWRTKLHPPQPASCFCRFLRNCRQPLSRRGTALGTWVPSHIQRALQPPPLLWPPEEWDSLPLTPPCRKMAGVERGRSEESLGWNVVRNAPPHNIASGKPGLRDLTERGCPRRSANPCVRTSKGFCLRRYRTPSPDHFMTTQGLTSPSASVLPCPQKQAGQLSVGTLAFHTLAVPSPSHHTPEHHPCTSSRERVRTTSRHLKWWDSDGLDAFQGPSPSLPRHMLGV